MGQQDTWINLATTVSRVAVGFLVSFLIGSIAGVLIGRFRFLESAAKPYFSVALTIPALCWGTIAILLFGISELTAVFTIAVVVGPVIALNFVSGMKSLDPSLLDMAKVFNLRQATIVQQLILPQLVPYALAATRYGFSLSWKVVVIVEMLGLSNGIGYEITYWFNMFSMEKVLALTLIFSFFMLLVEYAAIRPVERRLTRWRRIKSHGVVNA
ncbi:ABC transporter permease [Thiococcus pfennigii]|uniref:ABC transporter permease n=1 Tax=Thiococcus pfennigii TaxID=1057 RepID=UPI001903C677|nr:ABC transporter permease subunit [Thiococcus pfennigii]